MNEPAMGRLRHDDPACAVSKGEHSGERGEVVANHDHVPASTASPRTAHLVFRQQARANVGDADPLSDQVRRDRIVAGKQDRDP